MPMLTPGQAASAQDEDVPLHPHARLLRIHLLVVRQRRFRRSQMHPGRHARQVVRRAVPPLSIYHGGRDFLVLAEPLIRRLEEKEKAVNVIKVTKLDKSEHCDFYWAAEAVEWAYESFRGESRSYSVKEGSAVLIRW